MFEPTEDDFNKFNLKAYKDRLLKAQAQAKQIDYNYIDTESQELIESTKMMIDMFARRFHRVLSSELELNLIKSDLVSNSKILEECEHTINSYLSIMHFNILTNRKHMKPHLKLVEP